MGTAGGGQALDIHEILDRHRHGMEGRSGRMGAKLDEVGKEGDRVEVKMGVGGFQDIDPAIDMVGEVDGGKALGAEGLGEFPDGSVLEAGMHSQREARGLPELCARRFQGGEWAADSADFTDWMGLQYKNQIQMNTNISF